LFKSGAAGSEWVKVLLQQDLAEHRAAVAFAVTVAAYPSGFDGYAELTSAV
jgi:hypothetical protein